MPDVDTFQGGSYQPGAFQGVTEVEVGFSLTIVCRVYDSEAYENVLGWGRVGKAQRVTIDGPSDDVVELMRRSIDRGGIP